MAFAEQSEIGSRYSLRPSRALPGSFRHSFDSDDDDDFAINSQPSAILYDKNNTRQEQENADGEW